MKPLARRLLTWILLNVVFAVIPLLLQINARAANGMAPVTAENLPDFAFLSIMLCVVAAGDVIKDPEPRKPWDLYTLLWVGLVFVALISVGLLALYYGQTIPGPETVAVKDFYLVESKWLAALVICVTTIVEIVLAINESRRSYRDSEKCCSRLLVADYTSLTLFSASSQSGASSFW